LRESNPQFSYEFTDRTSVVASEELSKVHGVDANCLCDLIERQGITEPVVQQVSAAEQPGRHVAHFRGALSGEFGDDLKNEAVHN
jgi:hypothetical protein